MKTLKLTIFKGAPTESKFENQMTLELGYKGQHTYRDAKQLMSDLTKCWNIHNDLIEVLQKLIRDIEYPQRLLRDSNGCMISTPDIQKALKAIKKAKGKSS